MDAMILWILWPSGSMDPMGLWILWPYGFYDPMTIYDPMEPLTLWLPWPYGSYDPMDPMTLRPCGSCGPMIPRSHDLDPMALCVL